jgi:hypothetical protein
VHSVNGALCARVKAVKRLACTVYTLLGHGQTLRHPNIVDFIGAVCNFPGPNEKPSDWNVGTMFEFW